MKEISFFKEAAAERELSGPRIGEFMTNPNKIRWMTRASIYEKKYGRIDLSRNTFFISDYVRYNIVKNFLAVTIAVALILMTYGLCNIESIVTMAASANLMPLLIKALIFYVIVLVVYTLITIAVSIWQYKHSRARLKNYYRMLKLIEKYGQEDGK